MERLAMPTRPVLKKSKVAEDMFVSREEFEKLLLSRKKLYRVHSEDSSHRGLLDPVTGLRIFPLEQHGLTA